MTFIDQLMIIISAFGDLIILSLAFIVLAVILVKKEKIKEAILFFISLFGGSLLTYLIKILVQKPRPDGALISASGYSFPSGHAVHAVIFYSLLIFLFKDDIKNHLVRYLFIFMNIAIILLVGLSRIYLRVHFASDVIFGYVLGLVWLTMCIFLMKYFAGFNILKKAGL